jgi:predicted metal-dependent HD superfamily phosphohydrolase
MVWAKGSAMREDGATAKLAQRWMDLFPYGYQPEQLHEAAKCYTRLKHCYSDPSRHYHTLTHIERMLETQEEYFPNASLPVRLAIWFHDVVYRAGNPENESQSAHYAYVEVKNLFSVPMAVQTASLVLVTKEHYPKTEDEQQLCDLDLISFASDTKTQESIRLHIRAEFGYLSESNWCYGRAAFLRSMLDRDRIFYTPVIYRKYEMVARSNIKAELHTLREM